jgi:hypothetical protein
LRRGVEHFVDVGMNETRLFARHLDVNALARKRTADQGSAAVGQPSEGRTTGDHALGANLRHAGEGVNNRSR